MSRQYSRRPLASKGPRTARLGREDYESGSGTASLTGAATSVGGIGVPGSDRRRREMASLLTAASELPAVRTRLESCSLEIFRRFRTIRTCTRSLRSSLLRAPVYWRRCMVDLLNVEMSGR